ncbi:hypothetical protein [Dactylosporangium maewongense]
MHADPGGALRTCVRSTGQHTSPILADRGKLGSERHLITDASASRSP